MFETTRRNFLKNSALVAASASLSQSFIADAFAADPLKIWTIGVAKVTKTWDEMGKQAGVPLVYSAKSGSADQAIQKFFVGDGQKYMTQLLIMVVVKKMLCLTIRQLYLLMFQK